MIQKDRRLELDHLALKEKNKQVLIQDFNDIIDSWGWD